MTGSVETVSDRYKMCKEDISLREETIKLSDHLKMNSILTNGDSAEDPSVMILDIVRLFLSTVNKSVKNYGYYCEDDGNIHENFSAELFIYGKSDVPFLYLKVLMISTLWIFCVDDRTFFFSNYVRVSS